MVLSFLGYISATMIGLIIGLALQRGRGCTNTAFRNLLLIKNFEMSNMIVVVVAVELIGYYILSLNPFNFQFVESPLPFSYFLIPFGGFIFGLGTVIAGGCAGGVCYRVGEGSGSSLLSLLGFATGIGFFVLPPMDKWLNTTRSNTLLLKDGQNPSLSQFLPRWFWTIIAVIVLVYIIYTNKNKESKLVHLLDSWTPIKTGVIIGIFGVFARYFSTLSGRPFGLSTTDGIGELFQTVLLFKPIGWAGVFIASLIIGAAISSYQNGEFSIKLPNKKDIPRFYGGGILLGLGAMMATGCNFGHIFGGIPELGVSSVFALIFMVAGNWVGSYFYYTVRNNEYPISTPVVGTP